MHNFSTAAANSYGLPTLRDPQAGTPGLLNVPYSTFAGTSVVHGATHSGRRFHPFVTRIYAQSGLEPCKRVEGEQVYSVREAKIE